jgi:hypothetical protein
MQLSTCGGGFVGDAAHSGQLLVDGVLRPDYVIPGNGSARRHD